MRITFDTNALVNLENGTGQIDDLRDLRTLHKARQIRICIPAMVASENQKGNVAFSNYCHFIEFLKKTDLDDMEELLPVAFWDVTFFDHCVFADDMKLDRAIHDILLPGRRVRPRQLQRRDDDLERRRLEDLAQRQVRRSSAVVSHPLWGGHLRDRGQELLQDDKETRAPQTGCEAHRPPRRGPRIP